MVEKRESGFLKWIRMGGIRRLKENCSKIIKINVYQHFEKVCFANILKTSNDGFLVSNTFFKNIP